jgi:CRISPR-associated protein Csh1
MVVLVIEAVARIGEYFQETNKSDRILGLIEDPGAKGGYKRVLIVVLKEETGEYSFSHVDLQGLKEYQNYLYKGRKGNVTDATPTCKITEIEKTFNKKFIRWFDNYDDYPVSEEEKQALKKMGTIIKNEKDRILADLKEKHSLLEPGENGIITLGLEQNGALKYLNDNPIFRNVLLKNTSTKFSSRYGVESIGKNAVCSICKNTKNEVYGFGIPWQFHTFDKPGFIAGGFNVLDSWKDTPVCQECASNLEVGKKHIEDHLDFSFYGFKYLLVPKLALGGNFKKVLDILSGKDQKRNLKLNRETKRITSDEEEILDLVKEMDDSISNSIMFYKKDNSSYRILLLIDGVLPSRLKVLFNAKDRIDELFKVYEELLLTEEQREKNHLEFNFGTLRRFFPQESRNRTFDKIFLEIVNKIFVGENIDYHLLIQFIVRKARNDFKNDFPTNVSTLNGFLLLHYLRELDLIREFQAEGREMNKDESETIDIESLEGLPLDEKIKKFFGANNSFFTTDAKKATFLEGVLAQKLLNIQWREKKATPFRTKLHGLNMNEALIKRLLPEIQNKLEEYGKNYYKELESIIAQYFVNSGTNWRETDDELSFYFVIGMDMQKLFKNEKEDDQNMEEA